MIAAATEGSPPRRISTKQFKKNPWPAVPRRSPEAGFHHVHYDFHGSGVNPTDSCTFLQSRIFPDFILIFPFFFFILHNGLCVLDLQQGARSSKPAEAICTHFDGIENVNVKWWEHGTQTQDPRASPGGSTFSEASLLSFLRFLPRGLGNFLLNFSISQ
jgi:hypothetical protein